MTSEDMLAFRERYGLTQCWAGALIGVSGRQWARMETGEQLVTPMAARLMRAFDVPGVLELLAKFRD